MCAIIIIILILITFNCLSLFASLKLINFVIYHMHFVIVILIIICAVCLLALVWLFACEMNGSLLVCVCVVSVMHVVPLKIDVYS
jgi:hypothetical protein